MAKGAEAVMAQTKTTLTEPWLVAMGRPLHEPSGPLEHEGGLYSFRLQNTFQTKDSHIIAIWVIDQYLRPTPQKEAEQLQRIVLQHRRNGNFDMARWYEELAHRTLHEYPPTMGLTTFRD